MLDLFKDVATRTCNELEQQGQQNARHQDQPQIPWRARRLLHPKRRPSRFGTFWISNFREQAANLPTCLAFSLTARTSRPSKAIKNCSIWEERFFSILMKAGRHRMLLGRKFTEEKMLRKKVLQVNKVESTFSCCIFLAYSAAQFFLLLMPKSAVSK